MHSESFLEPRALCTGGFLYNKKWQPVKTDCHFSGATGNRTEFHQRACPGRLKIFGANLRDRFKIRSSLG